MAGSVAEPGVLMARRFALRRGPDVRLRLARPRDEAALRDLIARSTAARSGALDPADLVHFDPRNRLVICAMALADSVESMLGMVAAELDGEAEQPEILVVDPSITEGLEELLREAVWRKAAAFSRALAA